MNTTRTSPVPARSRRARRLRIATVVAVGAALALPVSASASAQLLKLAGPQYRGESTLEGHVNSIEIVSASFNIKRSSRTATAPTFGHLTVTKPIDRSSPALMVAAASGEVIPSARLSVLKTGDVHDPKPHLEYCFENVVVMSDQVNTGGGERPDETVTLSYNKVTQSYAPFDGPDPIVGGWSLQSGPISVFPTTCGGK